MTTVSTHDYQRLENIKKQLSIIGWKESTFITIELLFYEALEISRIYGDDMEKNSLLKGLKLIQVREYAGCKEHFAKQAQREKVIRQFINAFRSAISAVDVAPARTAHVHSKDKHETI